MNKYDFRTAVILTTDRGFLIPTLVVASQIFSQIQKDDGIDILIFILDIGDSEHVKLIEKFPEFTFVNMGDGSGFLGEGSHFNKTHVPKSTMLRLSIGKYIPEIYENIIYFDGDLQILGSIRPLLTFRVPEGKLLAGWDSAVLACKEYGGFGDFTRNYLKSLGVPDGRSYSNAGIMAARRSTWIEITGLALNYFNDNSKTCQFHDQSAINAVAHDRIIRMHPKYNFITWFQKCENIDGRYQSILHFTGAKKPWSKNNPSFNGRFKSSYSNIIKESSFMSEMFEFTSGLNNVHKKYYRDVLFLWRQPLRRYRLRRLIQRSEFAFD